MSMKFIRIINTKLKFRTEDKNKHWKTTSEK